MTELSDEMIEAVIEAVLVHSPYMDYDRETEWCSCNPYLRTRGGTRKRDAVLWSREHHRAEVRAVLEATLSVQAVPAKLVSDTDREELIAGLRCDAGDYAKVAQNIPMSHELSWDARNVRAWEAAEALSQPVQVEDTEYEERWEYGQPNGLGEIEPSWYREWYTPERETHRRKVITLTGPWEPLPEESGSKKTSTEETERETHEKDH